MNNRSEVVKSWFLSGRRKPFFRILIVMLLISVMAAGCAPAGPTVPATDPVPSASETPTESPSASLSTDVPVTEPTVPPSTEPTTPAETEATTPAETEPTEPASETPEQTSDSHPEETRPHVEVEKRVSLSADQMGVMIAQQEYCWTADAESGSPFTTGAGAEDFYYSFLLGKFMLHGESSMVMSTLEDRNPDISLNCTHPRQMIMNMEPIIMDGWWSYDYVRVFYILCDEGLLQVVQEEPEIAPEAEDFTMLPLPNGVSLQDIRELGVHEYRGGSVPQTYLLLMTYQQGSFFLDRNLNWRVISDGYQMNWKDDQTLEIYTDTVCWTVDMPKQQVWVLDQPTKDNLVICVKQEEEDLATVYDYRGDICLASTIDMSDWVSIPEHFAHLVDGSVYVLAPKTDRVELMVIETGVTSVKKAKAAEDLTDRREAVLAGEVLPLYSGKPVDDDFRGFRMDLDGDGVAEEIIMDLGRDNHNAVCWELYQDNQSAGIGRLRSLWDRTLELRRMKVLWPEEATFSREEPYRMYLASLDGERVTLFLESDVQVYGLDFCKYFDPDETMRVSGRTRIRGLGKSMEDFTPGLSLDEYIAQGWQVSPSEGDRLDLTGDGQKNTLHWRIEGRYLIRYPYTDVISLDEAEETLVDYEGDNNAFADERGKFFRYGALYYAANDQGGYDLIGELAINGRTLTVRYQLTDDSYTPLKKGDDFSLAGYRNTGIFSRPLPGWEGVSDTIKDYFMSGEGTGQPVTPVSSKELTELRQLFEGLFAGHFLLSEYQDVREIDLSKLFHDGVEEDRMPRASQPVTGEERAAAVAADGGWDIGIPVMKLPRQTAEDAFLRYTGYPLSEAAGEISMVYLEAYDAWYFFEDDSVDPGCTIVDAGVNPDGSVTALWRVLGYEKDDFGLVTLVRTDQGWHIQSNRFLNEEELR